MRRKSLLRADSGPQRLKPGVFQLITYGLKAVPFNGLKALPFTPYLNESFAALDPNTLRSSLQCVMKRAPALMVIAHP